MHSVINLINSFKKFYFIMNICPKIYELNYLCSFEFQKFTRYDWLHFSRCISSKLRFPLHTRTWRQWLNCVSANIMRIHFQPLLIFISLWIEWIYTSLWLSWNRIHIAKIVNVIGISFGVCFVSSSCSYRQLSFSSHCTGT